MDKIRVLILTGVNNHDWKRTAPFCKDLLEKTGRFDVEISDAPSTTLSSRTNLNQYQLFLLDYNTGFGDL